MTLETTPPVRRGYRFRLYPTPEQEALFRQFAGACRFVYNLALEQREREWTYYRDSGTPLTFYEQSRQLTDLRAEVDWLAAMPRSSLEYALRDLDRAYQAFFAGRAKYPTPRRKGVNDAFRCRGREVSVRNFSAKWSAVKLPKIGWVRLRMTRQMPPEAIAVTISLDALGWHASFDCEVEAVEPVRLSASVGIDRGVANTLALSTGEMFSVSPSLDALDRRHRTAQQVAARRVKGSKRRAAAQRRVAGLAARRARIRKDWLHKTSSAIANRFGTVVMEDLKVANMTAGGRGKRGLNRSILNQGWTQFAALLDYKLTERGGTLVLVNPAYTSQQCSECGVIDKESRESQAVFNCRHCGFRGHADTNASLNILRRANSSHPRVEGTGCGPDEARTTNHAHGVWGC